MEALSIGLGFLVVFYCFILFPLCALVIVANWKIFRKAGEPGWKSIVPGYNFYVLSKFAGLKRPFLHTIVNFAYAMLVSTVLTTVLTVDAILYGGFTMTSYMDWFWKIYKYEMLALLPIIVLDFIIYIKLAKAFGRSVGFGIGLTLFSSIFIPILGFGKSKYVIGKEEPETPQLETAEPVALVETAEMTAPLENTEPATPTESTEPTAPPQE